MAIRILEKIQVMAHLGVLGIPTVNGAKMEQNNDHI
jgi:hypothetical protein